MPITTLAAFESNVFSQFGEDGILSEILLRLQRTCTLSKHAIEFGASDGVDCSNTRNLLVNQDYFCVYIESDRDNFELLELNTAGYKVLNLRTYLESSGSNSLRSLISLHGLDHIDFDVLSIDVDGEDYHLMNSLDDLQPKIIIIEFNPTIPLECEYIQPRNSGFRHGSSARAIHKLGIELGYSTIYSTSCNLFLLRNDLISGSPDLFANVNNLELLVPNPPKPNYIFSGIDGSVIITNDFLLHWHRINVTGKKLQILPKYLRKATGDYSKIQRLLFSISFRKRQFLRKLLMKLLR